MSGLISPDRNCGETDCKEVRTPPPQPVTVGQALDSRINRARQEVEALCIVKAKAEAAQILNYPVTFIENIVGCPF